jgi:hypothetical protein
VIDLWDRIVWSQPKSPRPTLCSLCFGGIGERDVPLMLWSTDGYCAQFCEDCQEHIMPLLRKRFRRRRTNKA